jgi:hypothetical protein
MAARTTPFVNPHTKKQAEMEDKIRAVARSATPEDRAAAQELVRKALGASPSAEVLTITPGTAAILYLEHNKQNREWQPSASEEFSREIANRHWHFTNQGIGFLDSGNVGDGQHRLAAIVLAGIPVQLLVAFGLKVEAIASIDSGKRRQASDFIHITAGTPTKTASRQQMMVKRAYGYLARDKSYGSDYRLRNNREIAEAMRRHEALLNECWVIAEESTRGRSEPPFNTSEAAAFVFMLSIKGWAKERILADLDAFQACEDRAGGNSPLFVAGDLISKQRSKEDRKPLASRFSAVAKAFIDHEKGVSGTKAAAFRAAMTREGWTNPIFPGSDEAEAAE